MKIIRAKSAGFCWGVERAINIARSVTGGSMRKVYSDGPLIHNSQMMTRLKNEGICELGECICEDKPDEIDNLDKNGVIVVRAHGISPQRREHLKGLGLEFRDATCPDVGIVAGKIRKYARLGYSTVIFGDRNHPEVIGLLGYSEGKGFAVQSRADVDSLPPLGGKVCMVSQTTMFPDDFADLADYLKSKYSGLVVLDTICGATKARQKDVANLLHQGAQAIVVIGGHHSANTCKLADLARRMGLPTYHIETAGDIDISDFKNYETVGVTAGASTPEFLIAEVCDKLSKV
jgi:4-hydroxy-3-methylbut-2-en-1-yl diphosphate reductase